MIPAAQSKYDKPVCTVYRNRRYRIDGNYDSCFLIEEARSGEVTMKGERKSHIYTPNTSALCVLFLEAGNYMSGEGKLYLSAGAHERSEVT